VDQAATRLNTCRAIAIERGDRPALADAQRYLARLYARQGNVSAAHTALTEAIDLYERVGMRRELTEARVALADLKIGELAEAAG
jgi:hypothetical protein